MDSARLVGYIAASLILIFQSGVILPMGILNFLPKEEQYFDLFIQMTVYISDAARTLTEMLSDKQADFREVLATDQGSRTRL